MTRCWAAMASALLLAACNAHTGASAEIQGGGDESFQQWKLPHRLREISGLALTADERLLAITDEEAIVYEIDYESGELVKAFALGDPTLRGDFEGIAVVGDVVWLMTSDGDLIATEEAKNGERVSFTRYETGLGRYCELEGLGQDAEQQMLFLGCKEMRKKRDELKIFQVSVASMPPVQTAAVALSEQALAEEVGKKHLRPSALAIDPESGNRILLAANHRALVILSPEAVLIDAIILPGQGRHKQAEGLEVTRDGRLLIADEGGNGRGRLAVYRWTGNGLEPE
ncbi:MAG: hypothetical protein ACI88G_000527 [Woeseiaceae bacterium]|jgi:uncharacterized protein YjiK/predicted small secreted protein